MIEAPHALILVNKQYTTQGHASPIGPYATLRITCDLGACSTPHTAIAACGLMKMFMAVWFTIQYGAKNAAQVHVKYSRRWMKHASSYRPYAPHHTAPSPCITKSEGSQLQPCEHLIYMQIAVYVDMGFTYRVNLTLPTDMPSALL